MEDEPQTQKYRLWSGLTTDSTLLTAILPLRKCRSYVAENKTCRKGGYTGWRMLITLNWTQKETSQKQNWKLWYHSGNNPQSRETHEHY